MPLKTGLSREEFLTDQLTQLPFWSASMNFEDNERHIFLWDVISKNGYQLFMGAT